jgi:hypothetical protein
VSSKDSDLADRRAREAWIAANLAEARQGMDRIRAMADEPAPERDA